MFSSLITSSELNRGLNSNPTAPLNDKVIYMTIAFIKVARDAFMIFSITKTSSTFFAHIISREKIYFQKNPFYVNFFLYRIKRVRKIQAT
jgi:hypothetical protein